ncbi:hypothetical protein Trydic_g23441 [Trypoxylus dichotomus]
MECTSIEVFKKDDFPLNICNDCLEKLKSAYNFKEMVLQSNIELHQCIQKIMEEKGEVSIIQEDIVAENNLPHVSSEICTSNQSLASIDFNNSESSETGCKITEETREVSIKEEHDIVENTLPEVSSEICPSYQPFASINCSNVNFSETGYKGVNLKQEDMKDVTSYNYETSIPLENENGVESDLETTDVSVNYGATECNTLTDGDSLESCPDTRPGNLPFKCKECDLQFAKKGLLRQHMNRHSLVAKFPCDECGKMFKYKHHVERHKMIHKTEGSYKCDICSKTFTLLIALRKHSETCEKEAEIPCDECGKTFKYKHHVANHKKMIHKTERPYKCDICSKTFKQYLTLQKHSETCSSQTEKKAKIPCDECGKTFQYKNHMERHKVKHITERPYKCDICSKTFKQLVILRNHKVTHTEREAKYVCEVCDRAFIDIRCFKRHKTIHVSPDNWNFACKTCGKSFRLQTILKKHMTTHMDDKPYVCTHCERSFKCKYVLKKHLMIHTGEKPFSCEVCKRRFREKGTLSDHMLTHTEETPYLCKLCHTYLLSPRRLLTHMRKMHGKEFQE